MSNLVWGIQDNTLMDHIEHVQNMVNQGWAVISSCTMFDQNTMERVYTTFLRKDDTPAPKNGVYMASLMEVLEKRVAEIVARLEVLEATADMDDVPVESIPHFSPFGTLIGFVESKAQLPRTWQFIPTDHIGLYQQVLDEAEAEDLAREGVQ